MESTSINLLELGIKSELFRLLTVKGGMYLSPEDQCSMDFISDICFQERKALFVEEVRVCSPPHIDGLRSTDLIEFIIKECEGEKYLPRNYSEYTPNRTWLPNICRPFLFIYYHRIRDVLVLREEALLDKKNFYIRIDPSIAEIFKSSAMVAINKGRSHKLLKKYSLRKEKEVKDEKEAFAKEAASSVPSLDKEIDELKKELMVKEREIECLEADRNILSDLFDKEFIDSEGNVLK